MTKILDVDLDVFVDPVTYHAANDRLQDDFYDIWSEDQVRLFLENKCQLNADNPKPGLIFTHHEEMFDGIARAIARGLISVPFDLVHVDAHFDVGCGQLLPYRHLLGELMHLPPDQRTNPRRGEHGLNMGTVVLYMAAQNWLRTLTYLHQENEDGQDVNEAFIDYELDIDQLYFQIPRCDTLAFDKWQKSALYNFSSLRDICNYPAETRVPLFVKSVRDASCCTYDFVILTKSPGFTPPKADPIFEFISRYIAPIE